MSGVVHKSVEMDGPTKREDDMHSFTLIRKLGDNPFPFDFSGTIHHERVCHRPIFRWFYAFQRGLLEETASERSLLTVVMTKIAKYDPDVLMGHDMFGFDFDVLLHRFAHSILWLFA